MSRSRHKRMWSIPVSFRNLFSESGNRKLLFIHMSLFSFILSMFPFMRSCYLLYLLLMLRLFTGKLDVMYLVDTTSDWYKVSPHRLQCHLGRKPSQYPITFLAWGQRPNDVFLDAREGNKGHLTCIKPGYSQSRKWQHRKQIFNLILAESSCTEYFES